MSFERTDPTRVLVLDDFLPNYQVGDLSGVDPVLWSLRSNYRPEGIIGSNTDLERCPLFQTIIDHIPGACQKLGLPPLKSMATMVYLVSEHGDDFARNIHWDDTCAEPWGYTFSYHWQGAVGSGGTVFYADMSDREELHRVEFRPNRLCVFPARYPHTGWAEPGREDRGRRAILSVFTVLAGPTGSPGLVLGP